MNLSFKRIIMSKNKNIRNVAISDFYCTSCGNKGIPIIRTPGKEREPGHLKKIFCLNCQQEKNMVEIKPRGKYNLNDFWIEFNYGNFDENGNRKERWQTFVSQYEEKFFKER